MASAAATLSVKVVTSIPSISRIAFTAAHTLGSSSTTTALNLFIDRQPHRKSRSMSHRTRNLDVAAVLLNNTIAYGEAQARTLRCVLGGEEWVEDPMEVLLWDARTGV